MKLTLAAILLPVTLWAGAQTEPPLSGEVLILPELTYGSNSMYIKANDDNTFQYNILDLENNVTHLTGKVSSLEPLVRTGSYTFNSPQGELYATGYYSSNIPFRGWKFYDAEGQETAALNYSAAIQFLQNFGDVDIGEDVVYEAKKAPKFVKKGWNGFLEFIGENAIYPPFPLINNEEGTVVCQFVIDKTGQLINARIVEGVNEDFDLEVLRILSLSPKWKPGKAKGGDPVNVMYRLAVQFKLPD
jgi:TonB family protein